MTAALRFRFRPSALTRALVVMPLLAVSLAGCSGGGIDDEKLGRTMVAPNRYYFYDCKQLANQTLAVSSREKTLRDLMTRAEQSPGGGAISLLAYRAEYAEARGSLSELRRVSAEKECPAVVAPPPAPVAAKPPAKPPSKPPAQRR